MTEQQIEDADPAFAEEPRPKPRARPKKKPAAVQRQEDEELLEALADAERAVIEQYHKALGHTRKGVPLMQVDRPWLYAAINLLKVRRAVIAVDTVEDGLEILERGVRFFRKLAQMKPKELEQRRKRDEFDVVELLMELADPETDARGWAECIRPSEFFGRGVERVVEEVEEDLSQRCLPVFRDRAATPLMGGVRLDGVAANHPQNDRRAKPKTARLVSQGEARPKPPLMANTDISDEIDSTSQRVLRDAAGLKWGN